MVSRSIWLPCLGPLVFCWGADAKAASAHSSAANSGRHAPWQSVGPAPPTILAPIAADPRTHTIYVGSLGGGVIKSTDGGATFRAVNNGLVGLTISGLVISPADPNIAYANTQFDGFFKTVDGGAHWTGGDWAGLNLVMDPNNSQVMYGASGPFDYLLKTTDGGQTWSYAADGLGEALVFTVAIDPHNSDVVYAGSAGQGAFKSTNAGANWKPINADTNINAILVDPNDGNIVYVGTDRHGVLKSVNAGRSFVRIGSPKVPSILSLAKSGQTLYAGTATHGVSESIDGGRTWRNSDIGAGLANVLSVDTADHEHILLSTNGGGRLATEDGGHHWHDGGTDCLMSDAPRGLAFDPQDSRHVYAGSLWGGGLFHSDDGGRHWRVTQFGSPGITVYGVAVDPVDHSVYATASTGGEGIWKSTDFGKTFTRIDRAPGAPAGTYLALSAHTITVDPHRHRTIYVPDSGDVAGLWRSKDAGSTWIEVDASDNFQSVTVDPTNSSIVYASVSGASGAALLKSVDGGSTFVSKSVGLPSSDPANTGFLQVDPQRPDVLYLGTEAAGLYKSFNAAESWFPINLGLGGTTHYDVSISGLAMDPEFPGTLYAATAYHSVFKTTSGGQ